MDAIVHLPTMCCVIQFHFFHYYYVYGCPRGITRKRKFAGFKSACSTSTSKNVVEVFGTKVIWWSLWPNRSYKEKRSPCLGLFKCNFWMWKKSLQQRGKMKTTKNKAGHFLLGTLLDAITFVRKNNRILKMFCSTLF